MSNGKLKKELLFFIFAACAISWPAMLLWHIPQDQYGSPKAVLKAFEKISALFAFGPFISALGVTVIFRGWIGLKTVFKPFLKWRVGPVWYFWALFGTMIAQWAALGIWHLWTGQELKLPAAGEALRFWCMAVPVISLFIITEETGWRGFVLPRIQSFTHALTAGLGVGAIWSFWHTPLWIAIEHGLGQSVGGVILNLIIYFVSTMLFSVLMIWVFNSSGGSLLLMLLMHGSSNASLFLVMQTLNKSGVMDMTYKIFYCLTLLLFVVCIVIYYGPKNFLKYENIGYRT